MPRCRSMCLYRHVRQALAGSQGQPPHTAHAPCCLASYCPPRRPRLAPGLHRVPWVGWLEFSEGSECKNSTHPPPDFPVKSAAVTGILPFFLLILKEFKDL
jgi:hypothetical protein